MRERFLIRWAAACRFTLVRWYETRDVIRRYPLVDWVQAFMLVCWGLEGLINPHSLAKWSANGQLGIIARPMAALAVVVGVVQACAYFWSPKRRAQAAGFGLWIMFALFLYVGAPQGKVAWGGHTILELMICLAVI